VTFATNLDHQPSRGAAKIHDERADRLLAAKAQAA
jgi:hypothetical protein